MDIKPKFTVSGYRGVWGETLNEDIVRKYIRAFIQLIRDDKKKSDPLILIGRDGRETGPRIKGEITKEFNKLGIKYIDGDIMPTPTVLFSVRKHKYDGAVIITASHNPIEYNGLKFVNENALFLNEEEAKKVNSYSENNSQYLTSVNTNKNLAQEAPNFIKEHVDAIIEHVDVNAIKNKKFKVAVDMINASACVVDPYLFEKLGVELIPFNGVPNGKFAHKPEPNTENLMDIAKFVHDSGVDLGFAHDPDADRLVVINEFGEVGYEEHTIVLATENILSKNPGKPVVINLSTSQMSRDIAKKYGSECFLAKVGEPNVVEEIIKHNAIIGGEGNGGVIFPTVNLARDSFMGIALILELLATRNKKVSEIIETFPRYAMKKAKWPTKDSIPEMCTKLKEHFAEAKTIEIDGIRLDFSANEWVHLHPSNTEPIFRLYGEAENQEKINHIFEEVEWVIFEKVEENI